MARSQTSDLPYIDKNVEHVGVSRLRKLSASSLRTISKALVVQENDRPLAVMLKYEQYLIMQDRLEDALNTIEVLRGEGKAEAIIQSLRDMSDGKETPLAEIAPDLIKQR